ncbi:MAG: 3-oxoacyl-[acyl-carrier-protein] synthase, KASIII, partial [uncultured Frankineae bacterium]
EQLRPQPARPDGLPFEHHPRAGLLDPVDAGPARPGDPARLRDQGAQRHRHPGEGRAGPLRQPLRAAARPRAEPVLGQPLRHHDVRQATDAVGGRPAQAQRRLPARARAVGGRRRQGVGRAERVRRAAGSVGRVRRGPHLRRAVRRVRAPQAPRDDAARGQADRRGVPRAARRADVPPAALRPRLPGVRVRGHPGLRRGRPGARGAAPLGDGPAQPVPLEPGRRRARAGQRPVRRRLRRRLPPAGQARARLPAPPGRRRDDTAVHRGAGDPPAGAAVPVDRRLDDVPHPAEAGVAGRRARRPGLHQRRHHPQQRLQLVAHGRGRDPGQDRDRGPPLQQPAARGARPAGRRSGAGQGRARTRRGRRRPGLHLHERAADPLGGDVRLRTARDRPDPRRLRHHRRVRRHVVRPGGGDAAAAGGAATGARDLRREVLRQDRQRPAVPHDLRRRRGRDGRRRRPRGGGGGHRPPADLRERPGQRGELDPVAQPGLRQQHHRVRPARQGAGRPLPRADDQRARAAARPGRRRAVAARDDRPDRPAPGQQDHGRAAGRAGRAPRRPAVLQHRAGRERLGGQHPAGHPRRRARRRHHGATAHLRAGLRRGRRRGLRRDAPRPRDRGRVGAAGSGGCDRRGSSRARGERSRLGGRPGRLRL